MNISNILTSIGIGLLATTSPCVFPLYPGYLAYISSNQTDETKDEPTVRPYFLGFFVLLGVLCMMLLLGAIISALSVSIGNALTVIIPLADMILIVLGILLMLNKNPFKSIPQIQVPVLSHPFANAFVYGLLYGPIALPCSGPLVISIFAISLQSGAFFDRLLTFLWFGIGFGLPLLVLSFLGGALQRPITRFFARHSRWVNLVSGLLILGLGIYDLYVNWQFIASSFGF
jgi:cytochrome c-type biogenesis protein